MILVQPRFEHARPEDDAGIRALLREQPLPGRVQLALEREPRFALGCEVAGERSHVFVLRAGPGGAVAGLATRSVSRVWWRGEPRLLGYLAHMRRAPGVPVTLGLLAQGFAACEETRAADELPFDLTSILVENGRARRLLEAGLPGLPVYEPLCRLVTLTLDVRAGRRGRRPPVPALEIRRAAPGEAAAVAGFLRHELASHPLAPVWSAADLCSRERTRGLALEDFHLATRGGRLVGCLALWDQRSFKQTVVRRYSRDLALARAFVNPVRGWLGQPWLPRAGAALRLAFLSHAAVAGEEPGVLLALLDAVLRSAACAELDHVVLGLAATDPLLTAVRGAFRALEVESLLYRVHPCRAGHPRPAPDHIGPLAPRPEVALL